ncbi:hypothetical protein N7U66_01445 [Lacinutrix neustonica]|uniref:Uncharacterized protein n=1 Tax=Lacinutrix neustonica TaxID=2980107 RepID=A0A9E8MVM8_9FLAO|nr:hypothetical protein [Lacinutrix neustonica]WAC02413.1 hypothetical protein N7U66_01445 [Lacinutrix neustonica]
MEANLSLFNQINSLSYWFLLESNYKSSIVFDAEKDTYYVSIKKNGQPLYSHHISHFSSKNKRFLQFELVAIVNSLLHIKETVMDRLRKSS